MRGVLLGWDTNQAIAYDKDAHILTIAQSGAGKNTSVIMPNLLTNAFKGSKIILDLKGENSAVCSYWKKTEKGGQSYRLNPWGIFDMESIRFNPFCTLDAYSDTLYEDCTAFAEAIIPEKIKQGDTGEHFDEMAREFIASFLMYLVILNRPVEGKLLKEVTPVNLYDELIIRTSEVEDLKALAKEMGELLHPDPYIKRALQLSSITLKGITGGGDNGEFRGIKTTLSKALKSFKSKVLAQTVDTTREKSLAIIDMLFHEGRDNNDLYISFPQSEMKTARVWLRLVLTAFIRDNIKNPPNRPVLFVLDEFPQLGTFNLIKDNAAFLRGYHVRFWFIGQNIGQFETNYGKAGMETIFENCTVKQFFNISDSTARYVSQKLGKQSIIIKNLGTMEYRSTHVEDVMSQTEIERTDMVINFTGNNPAFFTVKRPYYKIPELAINALPNPLIHGLPAFKKEVVKYLDFDK
ncbi:MAG: type IV secretory system conjugative DNA transfer family protein [Cellulophaga sp.]